MILVSQNKHALIELLVSGVYQLVAQGRWFSPASSTTKTGRHDIAEILLKVALNMILVSQNKHALIELLVSGVYLEIIYSRML
jgi:hypothetical protein